MDILGPRLLGTVAGCLARMYHVCELGRLAYAARLRMGNGREGGGRGSILNLQGYPSDLLLEDAYAAFEVTRIVRLV